MRKIATIIIWLAVLGLAAYLVMLPEYGFFMKAEKPKECIIMKPDFPEYYFMQPEKAGYRKILSYNGSVSGYWKVLGKVEKTRFRCYRLVGFNGSSRLWKVENRTYDVLLISKMMKQKLKLRH